MAVESRPKREIVCWLVSLILAALLALAALTTPLHGLIRMDRIPLP